MYQNSICDILTMYAIFWHTCRSRALDGGVRKPSRSTHEHLPAIRNAIPVRWRNPTPTLRRHYPRTI